MKTKALSIALVTMMVFSALMVIPAYAKTKEEAIADGMGWLAAQQDPTDGSWGHHVGRTGLAVLKFETHAIQNNLDPLHPSYTYYPQVRGGLDYIFANAYTMTISVQTYGDPDTDGDTIGVYFVSGGAGGFYRTYETGIAIMAIASSTHPGMVVNVPGSAVDTKKYRDVVQDAVDYLAFGQNDAGWQRGGWGYYENYPWSSDNSNTGYAVLGLGYAQASPPGGFELTVPEFVKNELDVWIEYIQNKDGTGWYTDPIGGSGYTSPTSWVNILKTGNLLYEMRFVGDIATTPRVMAAINYLVRHWGDKNDDPGWRGDLGIDDDGDGLVDEDPWDGVDNDGDGLIDEDRGIVASYQAMYCVMKGLEAFGIAEIDGIDWQADFEAVLIAQQNPDGSWPPCYWGDSILATEWALLTLEKAVVVVPPTIKEEIEAIEAKLDLWLPEIKKEIVAIEDKLDEVVIPGLKDIKEEVTNIEAKLDDKDFGLKAIKEEVKGIETKLDEWLPKLELKLDDIKKEIERIEWKLKYTIDKEAVEVEILTGKDVGVGTQILQNKFVYYMMTTVAGQKCDYTKIEIEAEAATIDPSKYTVTRLKTGVYRIEIDRKAVPVGTKLIVIQVEYKDPVSGVVYYGAAITTAFNV